MHVQLYMLGVVNETFAMLDLTILLQHYYYTIENLYMIINYYPCQFHT